MSLRHRLLKSQKRLSHKLQRSARTYLGNLPPHLKSYAQEYHRELREYEKICNKIDILDEVFKSHVILCGDYHTLSQAQRTVIRILRDSLPRFKKEKKNLYLGLEILRAQDNIRVQQFLNSEISEPVFLKSVAFEQWGFDWQNYRPLFELAKQWKIPIFGLSPNKALSLHRRDQFAAEIVASWASQAPKATLMCLMGDLHLAQKHLPTQIQTAFNQRKISKRILTIHQNHDALYWKLAEKKLEHQTEVVKLKDRTYCILNTPPWIKLQNHLKWIELSTECEDDLELLWKENCLDKNQILDPLHDIGSMVAEISAVLGVEGSNSEDLAGVEILGPLTGQREQNSHVHHFEKHFPEQKNFFVYPSRVFYLTTYDLNHVASQSAQYLHGKLSGFNKVFEDVRTDFYPFLWVEALGYLGSKLINPRRKCYGIQDFSLSHHRLMRLAHQHIRKEKKKSEVPNFTPPVSLAEAYHLAQLLGKLLGQGLFELVQLGQVTQSQLKQLFQTCFDESAWKLYQEWIQRIDRKDLRNFSYRDKL